LALRNAWEITNFPPSFNLLHRSLDRLLKLLRASHFPDFPGNSLILLFPYPGFSDSPLCTLNSALLWSPSVKVSQSQSKRFGKADFDLLRAISTKKLSQFKVIQGKKRYTKPVKVI
jgi:hypothetical protein